VQAEPDPTRPRPDPGSNASLKPALPPAGRTAARAGVQGLTARLVDIATDETDPNNLSDTEPSIAVNPANPLQIGIVTFSERWSATSVAPVWKSDDGGATWRKVFQIGQPAAGSGGPGDQKIVFGGDGRLYAAELGGGDYVFRQDGDPDDPLTPGARYGDDQPHLDVDRTISSPCFNRLYSPWLNFGRPRELEQSTISSSSDGGETMGDHAVGDNSAFQNRTTRIAIAPSGKAFAVYKTREGATTTAYEKAHFRVARSDDCGASWQGLGDGGVSVHGGDQVETWFTSSWGVAGPGRKVARARSSDAWIATSALTNSVYVVYVNRGESGLGQIFLARSDDDGATWTSSRVTDGTHPSAYPEVAVADNGTVGVLFIDYEDTGTATVFSHHFARSFDGGLTWADQILQSMDPFPMTNAPNGFLWGDYEGLTAAGNTFYGVFTGASVGRTMLQFDPIFFSETADPKGRATTRD
jgi:hypothetical protein